MKPKFKIGDVIKIKERGGVYEYYGDAFKHFGIIKYAKKIQHQNGDAAYILSLPNDFMNHRWIVQNIAIHENGYDILYLLGSLNTHQYIVYTGSKGDSRYLELDKSFPQDRTNHIREKNKNHLLVQINKY